ncbi:Sad1-like protein [Microdochium nivale]|nr:Sad1-like protein [Microdochium nivale]
MSTRRTTRALSARLPEPANGVQGSPPESPYDFAATPKPNTSLRARRSTTRRARSPDAVQHVVLREPKGADTPDMQARYDNSYGNNSFIGLESASKRRRAGIRTAFDDEDEEDRRFREQLRGKPGKYIGQANLNEAIDETRKEAARETEPAEDITLDNIDGDQELSDPLMLDEPEDQNQQEQSSPQNQEPLQGQMLPPTIPASMMPKEPESPTRLDSSRSFNHESGLFEDATLHTPVREPTKNAAPVKEPNTGVSPSKWLPTAFSRSTLPFVRSSLRKTTASLRHNAALLSRPTANVQRPEAQATPVETNTNDTQPQADSDLAADELRQVMAIVLRNRGQTVERATAFHPLNDLSPDETEEVVTYMTQTGRSRPAARRLCKTLPTQADQLAPRRETSTVPRQSQEPQAKQPRVAATVDTPVEKESDGTRPHERTMPRSPVSLGEVPRRQSRSRGSTPISPSAPSFVDRVFQQYHVWFSRLSSLLSFLSVFLVLGLVSSLVLMLMQAAIAPVDPELSTFTNFKHSIAEVLPAPVQQALSDGDLTPIWSRIRQHDSQISQLLNDDASIKKTIESIKMKLPEKIYITTSKAGKPEITQDFWHALRDKIKADDLIVTFENAKQSSPEISDTLWRAVKSRLETDDVFRAVQNEAGSGVTKNDLEKAVDTKLARSWESWQERNDAALRDLRADTAKGTAIKRDDFMGLLEKEVSVYKQEIQREIVAINSRLAAFQQDFEKLGSQSPPGGMTKREVQSMIASTIDTLVSQGGLDAIANGQIRGHAASQLYNQVNFFSIGSGAVVDPGLTSKAWTPLAGSFKSPKYLERDGYKPQPAGTVLRSWTDENECFCAAPLPEGRHHETNAAGISTSSPAQNLVSVLLSRDIVPQHLVVEHILPGATLNPGATPRTIEMWAYIEEMNLRQEVEVFSRTQFPNTPKERVLNEGFQKIGHFTYEQNARGGGRENAGMQVFKISDELSRMGAVTNHVVVRALDNYGADHTCFYRLRLYGEMPGQGATWRNNNGGGDGNADGSDAWRSEQEPRKKGWFS